MSKSEAFSSKYISLGGALSGFFGGLSGHQGTLRSAFLIRSGLSKEGFIGTAVICAVVVDVVRLIMYGQTIVIGQWRHIANEGVLGLVLAGSACAVVGSLVGVRFIKKITMDTVHWIVGVLLLLVAIGLGVGLI